MGAVAPAMFWQASPWALQRCHWNEWAIVGVPLHVPGLAVSVPPRSTTEPVTLGGTVLAGSLGWKTALPDTVVQPELWPP